MTEWIEGKVVENIHWTESLFSLRIDADINPYTAGQFTSLALEINGERVARPYSFLSPPDQKPLEFFFYTAIDGLLSNALVKLNAGDSVWVMKQAHGFFTLSEVPDSEDIWMLGTGTGIAPFYSILKMSEVWQRFRHVVLVHAVRTQADLRYLELAEEFRQQYGDRFRFQAFVSRENIPGTIKGRIPAAIADGSLEAAAGLKLAVDKSQIMLCGNPDMVKDAIENLKQRGFTKNRRRTPGQITVENYW